MNSLVFISLFLFTGQVNEAEKLYFEGKYVDAIQIARETLVKDSSLGSDSEIELKKIIAFSQVGLGKTENAKLEFMQILELDSTIQLDPELVSPKIIEIFHQAREEYLAGSIIDVISPPIIDTALINPLSIRKAALLSMALPGSGQLYAGKRPKGWLLIAGEGLSISGLVLSQIFYQRARKNYLDATDPEDIEELYRPYNSWFITRNSLLGLSLGIWIYAPLDILVFPPEWGKNR